MFGRSLQAALAPFRSLRSPKEKPENAKAKAANAEERSELHDSREKRSERQKLRSEKSEQLTEQSDHFAPKESKETEADNAKCHQPAEIEKSSDSLQVAQVPGLRIWEPKDSHSRRTLASAEQGENDCQNDRKLETKPFERPDLGQIVQAPSPAFTRSGSFEHRVRAEGHSALTSSKVKESVPCRCGVVRGKAQRSGLQGFDCEQCRNFYAATKAVPKADDLKASRHRSNHAPTCTPPGWRQCNLNASFCLAF